MKFDLQRKSHWAAGSYIDLILAAVCMQILFLITAIWVGTYGGDFYNDNLSEIRFSLRMQLILGWMMCIIVGIGFSILPLIYDVQGFEKTLMRVYVGMNVSGQVAIMTGIMSRNLSMFHSLSTIGITLLCTSLVCLWPAAKTIFNNKNANQNKVGPFSYALGAFLPLLGIITLSCWVLRSVFPELLSLSEDLIYDFFMPLALTAVLVSYFNRRLDWKIIEPKNIGKIFTFFTLLLFLSFISEPLQERGDVSLRLTAVLQFLPYFFIFIMLNPKRMIHKIRKKNPYNKMVFAPVLWLPLVGIAAYMETMGYIETTNAMMSYYRWILIFGVGFQALWGFVTYLHDDHKKLSIHARKTLWLVFISVNIGTIITIYAMGSSWYYGEAIIKYPRAGIAAYALSYIFILIHWIKETFFSLDDWHKIPMFYDQYLANPEQGSGSSEKN